MGHLPFSKPLLIPFYFHIPAFNHITAWIVQINSSLILTFICQLSYNHFPLGYATINFMHLLSFQLYWYTYSSKTHEHYITWHFLHSTKSSFLDANTANIWLCSLIFYIPPNFTNFSFDTGQMLLRAMLNFNLIYVPYIFISALSSDNENLPILHLQHSDWEN
jgi:hypothetical protein